GEADAGHREAEMADDGGLRIPGRARGVDVEEDIPAADVGDVGLIRARGALERTRVGGEGRVGRRVGEKAYRMCVLDGSEVRERVVLEREGDPIGKRLRLPPHERAKSVRRRLQLCDEGAEVHRAATRTVIGCPQVAARQVALANWAKVLAIR